MEKTINLKSSVQEKGKTVTQIVTFVNGIKKTFPGVKTETIVQGQFTHFDTENGRRVMVNDKNVLFVEVFEDKNSLNNYEDMLKPVTQGFCSNSSKYGYAHKMIMDKKTGNETCEYCGYTLVNLKEK